MALQNFGHFSVPNSSLNSSHHADASFPNGPNLPNKRSLSLMSVPPAYEKNPSTKNESFYDRLV